MTKGKKAIRYPPWFYQEPTTTFKYNFKKALALHILYSEDPNHLPTPTLDLYKDILPDMADLDSRWKKVTSKNFDRQKFRMHGFFANTIRNTLKSENSIKSLLKETEAALENEKYAESDQDENFSDKDDQNQEESENQIVQNGSNTGHQ